MRDLVVIDCDACPSASEHTSSTDRQWWWTMERTLEVRSMRRKGGICAWPCCGSSFRLPASRHLSPVRLSVP